MTDEERQRFANRLRERDAEIERLRAALTQIASYATNDDGWDDMDDADTCAGIAKAALEPKP